MARPSTTDAAVVARVRKQLARYERDKRFLGRAGAGALARELGSLLADIQHKVSDPATGFALLVTFYEHDDAVFRLADDSSGYIGDVFREHARALFASLAKQLDDEALVIDTIVKLLHDDGYGVRDPILAGARDYLSDAGLRQLLVAFEPGRSRKPTRQRGTDSMELYRLAVAEQIGDPQLYEAIQRELSDDEVPQYSCLAIARVYLRSGDADSALVWAEQVDSEVFQERRDELLVQIHKARGSTDEAAEVAWASFRRDLRTETLDALLAVVGASERERAIDEALVQLEAAQTCSVDDACFAAEVGRLEATEAYLLRMSDQLDGRAYDHLLYLADSMERGGYLVCTSVLYRSLTDSLLERAASRYYRHAVRYVKKLDRLAKRVDDWKDMPTHADYRASLKHKHARKSAFWRLMGESASARRV